MANLGADLTTNQYLTPADYLRSPNGLFFAIMQADGNFCVYRGSSPTDSEGLLWNTGTTQSGGQFFAVMQADGNFVIYAGTGPSNNKGFVWSSSGMSQPQGSYFAIVQNDGNFCVYRGTGTGDNQGLVWNSGVTVQSDSDLQTAATGSGSVTCTLSTGTQVDLTAVLAAAQAVNSSLTTSSPFILIAYGATGGYGKAYDGSQSSPGGQGGQAQMTLSVESFAKAYNGTMLYFLFGAGGSTEHWGGKGGSSTIVSTVSFITSDPYDPSVTTPSTANVLLCAGGGGGASATSNDLPGRPGGSGGSATSSLGKAASVAGLTGGWDPVGGAGGANGTGGAGGSADGNQYLISGGAGTDGFGGFGGPVHLSDGPSSPTYWTNLPYAIDPSTIPGWVFPAVFGGQGGEGEARGGDDDYVVPDGTLIAEGGGGGGGYGGGGGGAGGVDQDWDSTPEEEGGGGGGGGSYAAASTITAVAPPYTVPALNSGDGYVMFIFPA